MPAVKISEWHEQILENEIERIGEEVGVTGTKKELVENAIEEKYDKR